MQPHNPCTSKVPTDFGTVPSHAIVPQLLYLFSKIRTSEAVAEGETSKTLPFSEVTCLNKVDVRVPANILNIIINSSHLNVLAPNNLRT